ncbi:MAG: ribbon-helix-helix protein, CopG family [Acidobacteria bacterium]|nr:ribbon-helix-helix protein, CopG family [Acidobacteriota bacterium]MYH28687.1 ribbon-helix-helix protein, CopG family [Acidobacteriota bacterium]
MAKVTYSLDDATVRRIRRAAERLGKPQSHVVREAVAVYDARTDRLSEAERLRMLGVLDRWREEQTPRSRESVESELREIRLSRRESSLQRSVHDDPS